jgi:hypothetical protein
MSLYRPMLFIHVTAVIGLFAALALEWLSSRYLRRAASFEQAREWIRVWNLLPAIGAPSLLVALGSGIYLASLLGAWDLGWVAVAVPTLVVVGVAGGLTAPARRRVRAALASRGGSLSNDDRVQLRKAAWAPSLRLRTALLLGLVFEMTVKPDAGAWVMVVAVVIALAWTVTTRS